MSLPHGLAEALHYRDPFPWGWTVAATLLALLALWVVLWARARARRRPPAAPAPVPPPSPPPVPASGLKEEIRRLLRRYRYDPRGGCHELAALLRRHLGESRGRDLTRHTARELERELGDGPVSRLFHLLAELQFARRRPSADDLSGACELALEAASGGGFEGDR